jgi:hypothetical protein
MLISEVHDHRIQKTGCETCRTYYQYDSI